MARKTGVYHTTVTDGEKIRAFIPHALPLKNPVLRIEGELAEQHRSALVALDRLEVASAMVPSQECFLNGFGNGIERENGTVGKVVRAGVLGLSEAGRINSYPLRWFSVDFSEHDRIQDLWWDEVGIGSNSGTRPRTRVAGAMTVAGTGGATAGPRIVNGVRVIGGRIIVYAGAGAQQAAVVGTLTATQIQNLIQSSGNRVVPLFTRLSQSPAAKRILYTATNPRLCDQIQTDAGAPRSLRQNTPPIIDSRHNHHA
jgi:hypothetical protein